MTKRVNTASAATGAGAGLMVGVLAAIFLQQWWLIPVGLVLGAGAGVAGRRKQIGGE